MYSLTHVFLYHWQHISQAIIPVDRTIQWHDAGVADWQAVLDALRCVLLADERSYSSSSPPTSPQENTYSPTNISYVAVELTDTEDANHMMTIGVCIEHRLEDPPIMTSFLLPIPLDPEIFVPDGQPLNKHYLRQAFRIIPEAKTFRKADDYRSALLVALGGLNQRFFALFARGIAFTPTSNTADFVKTWLLDARPLDLETLHRLGAPYAQLGETARDMESKLTALRVIVERQAQIKALRHQMGVSAVLTALLRLTFAERWLAEQERQIAHLAEQIDQGKRDQERVRLVQREAEERIHDLTEHMRLSPFMQRHDELQREIRQLTSDASMVQSRWLALLHDLRHQSTLLQPMLSQRSMHLDGKEFVLLAKDERASIQTLLQEITTLTESKTPNTSFLTRVDEAISGLDSALERALDYQYQIRSKIDDLRMDGKTLLQRHQELEQGGRGYPDDIERLCVLLTHMLGERPPLLCEVLEVVDERWQQVIEVLLERQRFTVLVQTAHFDLARRVLREAAIKEQITHVGILHVVDTLRKSRPAMAGSLAQYVEPLFPSLRPVVDTLLGEIIACEVQEQLFRHQHAVTPDGLMYHASTLSQLPAPQDTIWFIGQRALATRKAGYDRQMHAVKARITLLSQHIGMVNVQVMRLKQVREWYTIRLRLEAPLDEHPLRERIAELMARQKGKETGEVAGIQSELDQLRETITSERQVEQSLIGHIAAWEAQQEQLQTDAQATWRMIQQYNEQANATRAQYPSAVATAMEQLKTYLPEAGQAIDPHVAAEHVRTLEQATRDYEMRGMEETQYLVGDATKYNTRYHFVGRVDDADEVRYATEEQHLVKHVLPLYKDQIAETRLLAMDALRDVILEPLRERFLTVKQQMERFNEALARLEPRGKRYRFQFTPDAELQPWFELIAGSHVLNGVTVVQHPFYQEHKLLFDQFYELLTRQPQSEEQQTEQARLLDYRSYFCYQVELQREGMMTKTADHAGEQGKPGIQDALVIPYYLTIAATFAQLYHLSERSNRPMLRLVVFDKAFVGLDQEHVATTQSIFDRLGLQLISPPESILPLLQAQVGKDTPHHGSNRPLAALSPQ